MRADYRVPGPYDVIDKIANDFHDHGVDVPPDLVAVELQRIETSVRAELLVTD